MIELKSAILDKFILPLEESTDKEISLNYFIDRVKKCINILKTINLLINFDSIISFKIITDNSITAGIDTIGEFKYIFLVNKSVLRNTCEHLFDTIIYHELCHILQMNYLFTVGAIFYTNKLKGNLDMVETVNIDLIYNNGHTALWKHYVNIINAELQPNPKVDQVLNYKDLHTIFKEETQKDGFEISSFIIDYWPDFHKE